MIATDTLIIGAGPYGLSLAANLAATGLPFITLGTPMETWANFMPPGMLLRSEAFASSLHAPRPGLTMADYCRRARIAYEPVGMRLQLQTFLDYARWFQAQAVGPVREGRIARLTLEADGFRALLADGGVIAASRVVLATGMQAFAHTPEVLRALPRPLALHSSEIGALDAFVGKEVLIVGAGQSALGLAALLREGGARVQVLARGGAITWNGQPETARGVLSHLLAPEAGLGPGWRSFVLSEFPGLFHKLPLALRQRMVARSWGPSGAWWLRERIVDKVPLHLRHRVVGASARGSQAQLRVSDGACERTFFCDHVIVATGFAVDMRRLGFLAPDICAGLAPDGGAPELGPHFESAVPGLYVVGRASAQSFGPAMRFIYGARFAAPRVARHLVATAIERVSQNARLRAQAALSPPRRVA